MGGEKKVSGRKTKVSGGKGKKRRTKSTLKKREKRHLSEIGYDFFTHRKQGRGNRKFWSEIGYGLFTQVLNWVWFLEDASSS